jgi:hypothetical protein
MIVPARPFQQGQTGVMAKAEKREADFGCATFRRL